VYELDIFIYLKTSWSSTSGRVVVMGDAAHAMAPFLGQGANQALQDAYQIALEIQTLSNLHHKSINQANPPKVTVQTTNSLIKTKMKNYENKRKFKTAIMGSKSGILGYLGTVFLNI
jgi:acetylornithine deacetylase/succinyl-diaminopimelate desuccinylase-like protein